MAKSAIKFNGSVGYTDGDGILRDRDGNEMARLGSNGWEAGRGAPLPDPVPPVESSPSTHVAPLPDGTPPAGGDTSPPDGGETSTEGGDDAEPVTPPEPMADPPPPSRLPAWRR